MTYKEIHQQLTKISSKSAAKQSQRFFKTGEGEYSHGIIFMGIKMPEIRKASKTNCFLKYGETKKLIRSKLHEECMLGLLILVQQYKQAKTKEEQQKIYKRYVDHFRYINNWDLVDVTCPHLVGRHLMERDRSSLYEWAHSNNLWTKRIAMVTNWWFIRNGDLKDVFNIANILLDDEHDLIHKAVGWMLREAGKKNIGKLEKFLKKNYLSMPRTMLRYSIEKFDEETRQRYLKGAI